MSAAAVASVIASEQGSYLDHVIYEQIGWGDVDERRMREEQSLAVRSWLNECAIYNRLDLAGIHTAGGVPLIPSYLFKAHRLACDGVAGDTLTPCLSSGTLGGRSTVLRDDRTLERFVGSVHYGISHMLGEEHSRRRAFVIGPPSAQAEGLWFSYVLSLVDLIYETRFFVQNERVDFSSLFTSLVAECRYEPILVAPPALVNDFIDYLENNGLRVDLGAKNAYIITAGGWKARQDEDIGRDTFRSRCASEFGLHESRIRDSFNMVELNSVLIECEHHRMHVPPWLTVAALDPGTLAPSEGDGVLAFIDPTCVSYPGAVLSEDVGRVTIERCTCGIDGAVLEFSRRVKSNEQRGCAMKMRLYDGA